MIDTQQLKAKCDLRRLVEADLGPAPRRGRGAYLWKCPFHQEHKGYSFAVWQDGYRCFGACNTSGDALDWLMNYRQLTFVEACQVLGETPQHTPSSTIPQPIRVQAEPPPSQWQVIAERIVSLAEETLWSDAGEPALEYLLARGLTITTIRTARLGYINGDYREWRTLEGLEVPCGIMIPWFASDALWAVKVRRAYGTPKYQQIRGGITSGLYGADLLAKHQVALFCEGEFDALLTQQEAGDLVSAVTLGSATTLLGSRWYAALTHCHTILVAYDCDSAGDKGANRLLSLSPRCRAVRVPYGKDIGEFYLNGGDVYGWVANALTQEKSDAP